MLRDVFKGFSFKSFLPLTGIEPVFQQVDVDASVLEDFEDDLHQRQPVRLILGLQLPLAVLQHPNEGQLELVRVEGKARMGKAGGASHFVYRLSEIMSLFFLDYYYARY